jgi:hypothetical protein
MGDKIICANCKHYGENSCKKWEYWQNVTEKYAKFILKYGGCLQKSEKEKQTP